MRATSRRGSASGRPELLEAAARELAGTKRILEAAERLLGPYRWRRFDLWIAPPSFPYGGMENPRLTFLSPSLLTGDGFAPRVVVHELATPGWANLAGAASVEHLLAQRGARRLRRAPSRRQPSTVWTRRGCKRRWVGGLERRCGVLGAT